MFHPFRREWQCWYQLISCSCSDFQFSFVIPRMGIALQISWGSYNWYISSLPKLEERAGHDLQKSINKHTIGADLIGWDREGYKSSTATTVFKEKRQLQLGAYITLPNTFLSHLSTSHTLKLLNKNAVELFDQRNFKILNVSMYDTTHDTIDRNRR